MVKILKNNLFSIIFVIIAILATCTLFWPIPKDYALLRTDLTARVGVGGTMDSLVKATHMMPILSPDQTTQDPLPVFPAQSVITAGVEANAQIAKQADAMVNAAIKANQHDLLVAGSLPKPDDSGKYHFVQQYQTEVTDYARWQKILNSGTRPAQADLDKRIQQLHDKITAARVFYSHDSTGNAVPDPGSVQQAEAEFAAKSAGEKLEMQLEYAQKCRVYLEPAAIPPPIIVDQTLSLTTLPDAGVMWDDQLNMWVYDDVTKAIARANQLYADPATPGGPPVYDVLHSPVKWISKIDRPGLLVSNAGDYGAGDGSPTPRAMPMSTTGRVSNALYDVLRFKVDLAVDAAKLPLVLHEMEVGQFITVLGVNITSVTDPATAATSGFRFGDKPVLNVELDCEELMMRGWTTPLLPDARKSGIATVGTGAGWTPPAATGQPGGTGGGGGGDSNSLW